jgi:transcription antitermination factor NusG
MGKDVWYIVQCNPNCERKAAREMRRRGFGVHIPRQVSIKKHHRTGVDIIKRRPLLTGYVFMRFKGPENWFRLRQCQGLKGVLYVDGHPYCMPQTDVLAIIRAQRYFRYDDQNTRNTRMQMRFGGLGVSKARRKAAMSRFHVGMHVATPMTGAERVIARILSITKKGTIRADVGGMLVEFTDPDNLEVIAVGDEAA